MVWRHGQASRDYTVRRAACITGRLWRSNISESMPGAGLRMATLGVVLMGSVASLAAIRGQAQSDAPTFERDVAPIISSRCASCHGPGGSVPLRLVTYEDVAPRAHSIAQVARLKLMPPWKPLLGGPFAGARSLSASEILTLVRWAADGAPRGTFVTGRRPSGLVPVPAEWALGKPDLVVALPEPYIMNPSRGDEFRTFVLPVPITETKYVEAVEISFSPSTTIRHADLRVDPTGSSRQRDSEDDVPGFTEGVDARSPDGYLVTWVPGTSATHSVKGSPWRLEPGVDVVLQMHLRKTDSFELVRPRVAFRFTNRPAKLLPLTLRLGRQDLDVAPEATRIQRDSYTLPVDVELHAMHPHASDRVTRVSAIVRLPTGLERTLIRIDDWDVNWQDVYRYVEPVQLPRGTTIRTEFVYDDSQPGRRNPDSPGQPVVPGQHPYGDRAEILLQVLPKTAADRELLDRGIRQ